MRLIKRFIAVLMASTMLTQFAACNAKETANNTASTVKDKANDAASDVKDKANDAASAVKDKTNDAASAVKDKANDAASAVKDKAKDAASTVKDKAKDAASTVKDKAVQAKDYVVDWYNQIDMTKFKDGWDTAVDFASSKYAAAMGSKYVTDVGNAINNLKSDINQSVGSARSTAQEAGFVAEKWVADTFNIDAVAGGSAYSADVVGSTGMGSVDVKTSYGENASLKYYNSYEGSASAQATDILQEYSKYKSKAKEPMSLDEYLNKYNVKSDDMDALYSSIYDGQTRIIPVDQYDDAVAFLKSKSKKFSDYEKKNGSVRGKARSEAYEETLNNLKMRLEAPDGTASKPATYDEMQAMAELAQKGDFDPSEFGITTSQIITPKYLVKQSVNAGMTAAALNTVLSIGPDIFSILVQAAKDGKFDEAKLKSIGMEGLLSATEGFVEGSVSCAILTACQAGKLGSTLKNVSPEVIGMLTVLTVDAIRYGYSLSKGEITTLDYSNLMAEEILVMVVSCASGALLTALLPAVPFSYMIGSLAGGMVASSGFTYAKEIVLEIKDGGGFEAIVPAGAVDAMNVITDKVADLKIEEQVTNFKDMAVSTANDGYIKIKSLVKID